METSCPRVMAAEIAGIWPQSVILTNSRGTEDMNRTTGFVILGLGSNSGSATHLLTSLGNSSLQREAGRGSPSVLHGTWPLLFPSGSPL